MRKLLRHPWVVVGGVMLLIVAILVVTVITSAMFRGGADNIRISRETTYLLEPLRDDGQVDYLAALNQTNSRDLNPEDNAMVWLMRAFGPNEIDEETRGPYLHALGVGPLPEDGDYMVSIMDSLYPIEVAELRAVLPPELAALLDLATSGADALEAAEDVDADVDAGESDEEDEGRGTSERDDNEAVESPGTVGDAEPGEAVASAGDSSTPAASTPRTMTQLELPGDVDDWLNSETDRCYSEAWRAADRPWMARWLEANRVPLEHIVAASQRQRLWNPLVTSSPDQSMSMIAFHGIIQNREAARILCARAMLKRGQGDYAGAAADLLAGIHLARLQSHGTTLVDQLVAMACQQICLVALNDMLTHDPIDATILQQMATDLDAMRPMSTMAQTYDQGERFFFLSSMISVAHHGFQEVLNDPMSGYEAPSMPSFLARGIDWNVVLIEGNRWYDRLAEACRERDPWVRLQKSEAISQEMTALSDRASIGKNKAKLLTMQGRSELCASIMTTLMLPALSAATVAEVRSEAYVELSRVAIRLAIYHREHGAYPDELAQLVPDNLPAPIRDPFCGQPLHYRRTEKGYLLYSVGVNGIDDRGVDWQIGGDQHQGDIVLEAGKEPPPDVVESE